MIYVCMGGDNINKKSLNSALVIWFGQLSSFETFEKGYLPVPRDVCVYGRWRVHDAEMRRVPDMVFKPGCWRLRTLSRFHWLQHTAAYYNTLQHTPAFRVCTLHTLVCIAHSRQHSLHHMCVCHGTLQHTTPHYNSLQHIRTPLRSLYTTFVLPRRKTHAHTLYMSIGISEKKHSRARAKENERKKGCESMGKCERKGGGDQEWSWASVRYTTTRNPQLLWIWRFMDSASTKNPSLKCTKYWIPPFSKNLVVKIDCFLNSSLSLST